MSVYFIFQYKREKAENIFFSSFLTPVILEIKRLIKKGIKISNLAVYYSDLVKQKFKFFDLIENFESSEKEDQLTYYHWLLESYLPTNCLLPDRLSSVGYLISYLEAKLFIGEHCCQYCQFICPFRIRTKSHS